MRNRFCLSRIALAAALAPAATYAQISCTPEDLKTATDLYIAAQTQGRARLLPVSIRMSYVENFNTASPGRLIDKPLKIDQHRSLIDTKRCETFTEALVFDKAEPYALGRGST